MYNNQYQEQNSSCSLITSVNNNYKSMFSYPLAKNSINYSNQYVSVTLKFDADYDFIDTIELINLLDTSIGRGYVKKVGNSSDGSTLYFFIVAIPTGQFQTISYIKLNVKEGKVMKIPKSVLIGDLQSATFLNFSNAFIESNYSSYINLIPPKVVDKIRLNMLTRSYDKYPTISRIELYDSKNNAVKYNVSSHEGYVVNSEYLNNIQFGLLQKVEIRDFPSSIDLSINSENIVSKVIIYADGNLVPAQLKFINKNNPLFTYNLNNTKNYNQLYNQYTIETFVFTPFSYDDIEAVKYTNSAIMTDQNINATIISSQEVTIDAPKTIETLEKQKANEQIEILKLENNSLKKLLSTIENKFGADYHTLTSEQLQDYKKMYLESEKQKNMAINELYKQADYINRSVNPYIKKLEVSNNQFIKNK